MRITNKIMQNNSLSNINSTKVAEDNLSSQISSGKKIVRPSDDPIIAIRALRLRSNVTEITQYYKSNVPDAEAWLNNCKITSRGCYVFLAVLMDPCEIPAEFILD